MYDLILILAGLALLPKFIYQLIFYKKYRKSLLQRLGMGFPKINKGKRKLIWIHAVSVGETKAVTQLAKALKQELGEPILLFSTVTETGFAEAKKGIPEADFHVFLPFDFQWIIKPLVQQIQPDLLILCETDFWYNLLKACKTAGGKVVLVNGKISERSLGRFLSIPKFSQKLFSLIDLFCLQSLHYKERFNQLPISESKLIVTGNIKFDAAITKMESQELALWRKKFEIYPGDLVLVAGSTHDPEEKLLIDALQEIWKTFPNLKTLIVPRHPERFDEVASLLKRQGIAFSRHSQETSRSEKVVLIDAMGLLRQCYQLADVALVAGSFTSKVGGHNIIEPCWYGVPVLFGPHMQSQPELVELVHKYQAGIQVEHPQLIEAIVQLLADPKQRTHLGKGGIQLIHDLKGASTRTLNQLTRFLKD